MIRFLIMYFLASGIILLTMTILRMRMLSAKRRNNVQNYFAKIDKENEEKFGQKGTLSAYFNELNSAMPTHILIKRLVLSILLYPILIAISIVETIIVLIAYMYDRSANNGFKNYIAIGYSKPIKGFNDFCQKNVIW